MTIRVAAGLARSSEPEHRWRRVVVPVSAAVFVLLVLAGSSVVAMAVRGAERVEQRTALLASKPSPTDLDVVDGDDKWRGKQYPVIWIEPAGEARPVLPPGMGRLPKPGQAVVSPALDREASVHTALAERYPDRLVLGSDGVQGGDELLAYVRMPKDRSISGDLVKELSGETEGVRVRAFGPPEGGPFFPLDPLSRTPSEGEVVGGVLGFLVLPGLLVLVVGLAAASDVRDRRFEVLRWVGAPQRTLVTLAVAETLILAVPGLAAAALLWGVIAPRLERVPLVGYAVVRGDLGLAWWLLAAVLGACVIAMGLVAITVTTVTESRRRHQTARPRPTSGRARLTLLRAGPILIGAALFVFGWPVSGSAGSWLNLGGIVAMIVGTPLIYPAALRVIGTTLGRLESVPVSIAGRGLEWDPIRVGRPFLGVAALLIIALAGSGYIAAARAEGYISPSATARTAVFVEWLDARPDDPTRLANALGTGLVVPFSEGGHAHGNTHEGSHEHVHEDALVVGSTCRQLSPYFPDTQCSPNTPYVLPAQTERRLLNTMSLAAHGPVTEVRLTPAHEVAMGGSALVLDNVPFEVLEGRVRDVAMRTLAAPHVYSWLSSEIRASPLVAWIADGILVAVLALAVGCLMSLVDRLLGTSKHRRHLLNLGVPIRQIAALEAWRFAAPYIAVVTVSFCVGLAVCILIVGIIPNEALMPWGRIGTTLVAATIAGLVGTASVALFGARNLRGNPE